MVGRVPMRFSACCNHSSLWAASAAARELFGERFVDTYAATRDFQEREFRARVTDQELRRFFELA